MKQLSSFFTRHFLKLIVFLTLFTSLYVGFMYYKAANDEYEFIVELVLVLFNTLKLFTFSPVITIEKAMLIRNVMSEGLFRLVYGVYIFCVVLAPLCTATAIIVALSVNARNFLHGLLRHSKKTCYVFGNGETARDFIMNNDELPIVWIVREPLKATNIREMLKSDDTLNKRYISNHDWTKMNKKQFFSYLNSLHIGNHNTVLFFEEDEILNVNLYSLFQEYLSKKLKLHAINVFLKCEDSVSEGLVDKMTIEKYVVDGVLHHEEANDLYDNTKERHDLYIFNKYECAVSKLFVCDNQNYLDFAEIFKASHYQNQEMDVHLLIIGFGHYGQKFMEEAIKQATINSKTNIIVDVVDKCARKEFEVYARNWSREELAFEYKDKMIVVKSKESGMDGSLVIRIHDVDVLSADFNTFLDEYVKKIDESVVVSLALSNSGLALGLYNKLNMKFKAGINKKYVLRLSGDSDLAGLFERTGNELNDLIVFGRKRDVYHNLVEYQDHVVDYAGYLINNLKEDNKKWKTHSLRVREASYSYVYNAYKVKKLSKYLSVEELVKADLNKWYLERLLRGFRYGELSDDYKKTNTFMSKKYREGLNTSYYENLVKGMIEVDLDGLLVKYHNKNK